MTSTTQAGAEAVPQFAHIAVPVHLRKLFTYRLPASMQRSAQVGSRVMVQLGKKPTAGYIVALLPQLRAGSSLIDSEIKEIQELLDVDPPLTPEVLEITRWVADYYAAPWGEVMRAALPAGINATVEQTVSITEKGRARLAAIEQSEALDQARAPSTRALQLLTQEGEFELNAFCLRMGSKSIPKWCRELENETLIVRSYRTRKKATRAKWRRAVRINPSTDTSATRITDTQARTLEILQANQIALPVGELTKRARVSESVIRTMIKNGLVEEFEENIRRDPLARAEFPETEEYKLTRAQIEALRVIEDPLKARTFAPILLHGITGSGKTEVYIRAMRAALNTNRGAMMLVPEIALTPILSRRLRAHFGDQIAIFHSSLSKGERFDEWSRLRSGEARLVLGTRSAVFAPVKDLGVIIVDEEQDASYRQEESPFYHARDTAIVRAQKESAVVLLGSATPSLESFHNAQTGKYRYVQLPERIANRPLAQAEIIDMREVFARRKKLVVFSDELLTAIEQTHGRGEQTIILRNRRGYSSFIPCRSCGESSANSGEVQPRRPGPSRERARGPPWAI